MRRALVAMLATGLAAALPASAAEVRLVVIWPSLESYARITCDTSAYPVAPYPCAFEAHAGGAGCLEVTDPTGEGPSTGQCRLDVRGTLNAYPAPSFTGQCSFTANGPFHVSFASGLDPAWQVETNAIGFPVQSAAVSYGNIGMTTPTIVTVTIAPAGGVVAGEVVSAVRFDDLMWDCRTRAGGDPSTVPVGPGPNITLQPTGTLLLARP